MPAAATVLFPWNDAYSVEISVVDAQHKVLVDLINELHQAMMNRTGKERLRAVLASLIQYTKSHFATEEGLLQANQYPDLANHKGEHERFTQKIQDFQNKFLKNEVALTIEVMDFLKDWPIQLIMGVDKHYVPYLTARGVH